MVMTKVIALGRIPAGITAQIGKTLADSEKGRHPFLSLTWRIKGQGGLIWRFALKRRSPPCEANDVDGASEEK
jgi:uncharacterized membrane protein